MSLVRDSARDIFVIPHHHATSFFHLGPFFFPRTQKKSLPLISSLFAHKCKSPRGKKNRAYERGVTKEWRDSFISTLLSVSVTGAFHVQTSPKAIITIGKAILPNGSHYEEQFQIGLSKGVKSSTQKIEPNIPLVSIIFRS